MMWLSSDGVVYMYALWDREGSEVRRGNVQTED